jgi:lipopolysaccharide exporter
MSRRLKKYFSSYWIRSAFYTFLQRFSLTFFGFLNLMLLTRSLSIPQYADWALFLTLTGIFEATKSALLKNAHIKFVTGTADAEEQTAVASSSFLINSSISVLFILLIIFFSNWLGAWFHAGIQLAVMLKWFIPGLIFLVFFAHLEAVQQSNMDFRGGFAGYLVRQVLFFGVILGYKLSGTTLSLARLSMYQSVSIGLGTLVLFFYTRKYLLFRFSASMLWVKKILGYGGYIFGSGILANISNNLDQLMTAKFISPGSLAYYNVASRINLLVDVPSYAASEILFPKTSRASLEEGKVKVKYLFERMVAVLLAFTIPAALFIILFPRLITVIIAGPAYGVAALILQLYMITGIFRPAQNQAANLLNSIGKPRLVFTANLVYLLLFLGINYICLSKIGFYGAAVGTLITSFIGFIGWYFIMRKEIGLKAGNIPVYMLETYRKLYTGALGFIRKPRSA